MRRKPAQDHGFLIVKRFPVLYREYARQSGFTKPLYAVPLPGSTPDQAPVQYRGKDRESLDSYWEKPALAAELRMHELEKEDRCWMTLVYFHEDMVELLDWTNQERPSKYESLWARIVGSCGKPPA